MISEALAILENDKQRNELSEIYENNINKIYSIAFSKLHNKEDAEDAMQEAFLEIAKRPDKFFILPHDERIAYINVVVRNVAIDMFNKKNKTHNVEIQEENIDDVEDNSLSLTDDVIGNISSEELLSFIKTLPVLQRDVLTMYSLLGFSQKETAEILKISLPAVKKRLYLARKAILRELNERKD